jgi:hypothetical protein
VAVYWRYVGGSSEAEGLNGTGSHPSRGNYLDCSLSAPHGGEEEVTLVTQCSACGDLVELTAATLAMLTSGAPFLCVECKGALAIGADEQFLAACGIKND